MIEPKIEHKGAFLVVGMRYEGKNEQGEIPAMWGIFLPRVEEIAADESEKGICYGVCRGDSDQEKAFEYLAGVPVTSLDDIPQGMVGWEIPENTYAVFPVQGLAELMPTLQMINDEWFPGSKEYERADGPMFELYPETFDSDTATLYLYFPVKRLS